MRDITHIFFDLDHTLWDYDTNAYHTLVELFHHFDLSQSFSGPDAFVKSFHFHNNRLWHQYNLGEIDKHEIRQNRFKYILQDRMEVSDSHSLELSNYFVTECPKRKGLLPGTQEVLTVLEGRYEMGIITNGFDEIQSLKLSNTRIDHFFNWVITSESARARKPDSKIFDEALSLSGATKEQTLMIGDNLKTDISGANASGWQSIWYNPNQDEGGEDQIQIKHLCEIPDLLM